MLKKSQVEENLHSIRGDMRPYGGYAQPPARIFEGTDEIDLSKKEARPAGSSEKGTYFWKMTQDKRFIEAPRLIPIPLHENNPHEDLFLGTPNNTRVSG